MYISTTDNPKRLRSWKSITCRDSQYIYNIARILSQKVDQTTIDLLEAISRDPKFPITEAQEVALLELELLASPDDDQHLFRFDDVNTASVHPVSGLTLMVAQRCNSRCLYCYGGDGEYGDNGLMDMRTAVTAVNWLFSQTLRHRGQLSNQADKAGRKLVLGFFGGEPLLNFSLIQQIVPYAKARAAETGFEFEFLLTTNGVLLDTDHAKFLSDHDFEVLISLDGPPDIHDRNRPLRDGRSSYAEVAPKIRELMRVMPPQKLSLHAVLWQSGELSRVIRHLTSFGLNEFTFAFASPGLHQPGNNKSDPPRLDEYEEFLLETADSFLKALRQGDIHRIRMLLCWKDFVWVLHIIGPRRPYPIGCGAGLGKIAVSLNGRLYPCHRFVGVESHMLGSIYISDDIEARLKYRNSVIEQLQREPCSSCWAFQTCNGGCVYEHVARTGRISTPNEKDCGMAKARLRVAIYLENELSRADRLLLHEQRIVFRRPCPLDM